MSSAGEVERRVREATAEGFEPLLLYPTPEACAIDAPGALDALNGACPRASSPRRVLLVMVDGTWRQAHHMMRHSEGLVRACTSIKFEQPANSVFDALRREPEQRCMSTAEACARALRIVEPGAEEAVAHIEATLSHVVSTQLACTERHGTRGPDGRWSSGRWTNRRQRTLNHRLHTHSG